MRFLRWLWPDLFGPPLPAPEPEPVQRIVLPPPPMYRDPVAGEWQPL